MASLLAIRDPFTDAKNTLSSWDKCMAKTYCKWPVIVAIIVGSLIVLSVVLCIARCICCGAEMACCCFKCCTCCCPSGRGHKRMKSNPPPPVYDNSAYSSAAPIPSGKPIDSRPINQQYRSHTAPTFNPAPEPPQFARFESSPKPVNEDALPAMPTWSEATSHRVEEEVIPEKRGDLEMDRLDQHGNVAVSPVGGAAITGAARRSPGPGRSPVQRSQTQDSYGFPPGYQNDSFANNAPPRRSPHTSPGPYGSPYGQQQEGYRGVSPVQSLSPVYGAGPGYAQNQQYDRRSPGPSYNQQQQQKQFHRPNLGHSPSPVSSNGYGYSRSPPPREPVNMPDHSMYNDNYAPAPAPAPAPVRSPSPGYAPSGSTRYEPAPGPAYPGQQSYEAPESAYPGQQSYQAFTPGQTHGAGVTRRAVDGSWKDV